MPKNAEKALRLTLHRLRTNTAVRRAFDAKVAKIRANRKETMLRLSQGTNIVERHKAEVAAGTFSPRLMKEHRCRWLVWGFPVVAPPHQSKPPRPTRPRCRQQLAAAAAERAKRFKANRLATEAAEAERVRLRLSEEAQKRREAAEEVREQACRWMVVVALASRQVVLLEASKVQRDNARRKRRQKQGAQGGCNKPLARAC